MKYSRGRIIALTILSVVMALALFCTGYVIDLRNFTSSAVESNSAANSVPGFDDLYRRVGFSAQDTGSISLGKDTQLTITEERYERGVLTEFLNASKKGSFMELQATKRSQGYPYPVFTNKEMNSIKAGAGDSLEIPVVLLDPYQYDDIVLFELTNLPTSLVVKRDGQELQKIDVDATLPMDKIYSGKPEFTSVPKTEFVYDEHSNLLLKVLFVPSTNVSGAYAVEIKDANDKPFYTQEKTEIKAINKNSTTQLYNQAGEYLYNIIRENNEVKVCLAGSSSPIKTVEYVAANNQIVHYEIGAVAVNGNGVRGMFREQGLYEISFTQYVVGSGGVLSQVDVNFAFIIVNKVNYTNFPRFNLENRMAGNTEIYNYAYMGEYPTVQYSRDWFDVQIQNTAEYDPGDEEDDTPKLTFYNIGEYQMVSKLRYSSSYLNENYALYANRGVKVIEKEIEINGKKTIIYDGYVELKRITPYSSVLNVFGFQAYYGGQHSDVNFNGPLPFFDNELNINSDISSLVRVANMTASATGVNYNTMRVSDALTYSNHLANYLTTEGVEPVRTNFPPVRIQGNVPHATGAGQNGEKAVVLSTVAYRAKYGNDAGQWKSSTLEVGAPFEQVGQYLVTVYFKVNNEVYQQNFFFEITNAAHITFVTTDDEGNQTTYNTSDLVELNRVLTGKTVTISYDGQAVLGKFEVPPLITLETATLGSNIFSSYENIENGKVVLKPGQYRLTVSYGAHNKSVAIYYIVVDNTPATGIKANTTAETLKNMPKNVAVVGSGKVNLTWDHKSSGLNYADVLCQFYEMKLNVANVNSDRNYAKFDLNKIESLYSAYSFAEVPWEPNAPYQPVKTETGWTLNETFQNPGLYVFTLVDEVGNETEFVLIIDESKPTFVQNGSKPLTETNMVNLTKNGVTVGFGVKKMVAGFPTQALDSNLLTGLNGGALLDETQTALNVGIASVEYSESGAVYEKISKDAGYIVLSEEGTYYFRVIDMLGNVGEYYIVVTDDKFLGTVYAETTRPEYVAENKDMVKTNVNINTALVTSTGGMTNREFVTFSFQQSNETNFYLEKLYLNYYPFSYDKSSKNYPFAENPVHRQVITHQDNDGVIYNYSSSDLGQNIRLALFNKNSTTPAGMYILTANYKGKDALGREGRRYFFIVDNQSMLHYEEGQYETKLKVTFGSKIANAAVFNRYQNNLESNQIAWVSGYKSKYSFGHDSIDYKLDIDNSGMSNSLKGEVTFSFPSLTPRFSYVHNGQTVNLGAGIGNWWIGNNSSSTGAEEYKLVITDDARNISCMLVNGNITELKDPNAPTSANYDYLTLNLDLGRGTKAEIQIGEDEIISNAEMEFDGSDYFYVIDPTKLEDLKFIFESDANSMFTDVDVVATTASWKATGFAEEVKFFVPTPINNKYTFDLMNQFLGGKVIQDGFSLSLSLILTDGSATKYTIIFDSSNPSYNLERIRQGDNLASILNKQDLPAEYIYGVDESFVFESPQGMNRYLDTKTITYREIDYKVDGTQPAVSFKIYAGLEGQRRIPFAELVGLRDNEMKYFMITETDYAGHTTSYRIQVQGSKYTNSINFIGATSSDGAKIQTGIEMHASKSSVHQFFLNNDSFKFENGDDYYLVLGNTASWRIGNNVGSAPKTEESLINVLNNWINDATEKGQKCSYTLYDRIGKQEIFEFYNIRENAAQMQLDCFQSSVSNNMVMLSVTNLEDLPQILFEEGLASLFTMTVEDYSVAGTKPREYEFKLYGTQIQGFDATHDLIIRVTDPFGRVSITEYHQQKDSTIKFKVNGNTVTENGVVYAGDERGVEFSYLRTAYNVLIYNAATGELMNGLQPPFVLDDVITYTFLPKKGISTVEQYRIVATGRASGSILFDKTFVFDSRLPSVEWKNASDQTVAVDGQSFVSEISFDISNSLVPTAFPVTISYTRTYEQQVERVTLKSGTQKFTFKQPGQYKVTLRNAVWAEKTFEFEIAQVGNDLVLVYDDGEQIQVSPTEYKYKYNKNNSEDFVMIPRYIFTTGSGDLVDYASHGLDVRPGQNDRVLAGNTEEETAFYYYDASNSTLVWKLTNTFGGNPIYIATTGVAKGSLNDSKTPIRLKLNGDPNSSSYLGDIEVSPDTTYHIVDDAFMKAHDNKIEVSLSSVVPYYIVEGNTLAVDCYFNGQLVKTLQGNSADQVFVINRYDAGYYEFVVHDMVGNYLYFGNSDDQESINYKQERYMLWVRTKPTVLINDKMPINGMIYNDKVELKLVDYGKSFLNRLFANELAQDSSYLNKYYAISKVKVLYTGSSGTEKTEITTQQATYSWNKSGTYKVTVTYRINDNTLNDMQAEYNFQIIPSHTIRETFSMSIYPDVQVAAVTRNGYDVHDFDDLKVNEYMEFDADINPGSYVVTLKTFNSILQEVVLHEVQFNIQHKANSARDCFILSSGSGTATTGTVTMYYSPYWLYVAQGDVTIYLYKNEVLQEQVKVDRSAITSNNYNTQVLFSTSAEGKYSVIVKDVDGDPVYMDSWTVNAKESTFGYFILASVLGVFGIGVLIFIRMRNKMATK